MATFSRSQRFGRDWKKLTIESRKRFLTTVTEQFAIDLKAGRFRPGLRVKRVVATAAVWEMTWAPDGRATFEYGPESRAGEPHVIWRRIGTHEIFRTP